MSDVIRIGELELTAVEAIYGRNYRPGYIGFTFREDQFLSDGIAWFTRWERYSDIRVSHVFVVAGADECIEAHKHSGVCAAGLGDRFEDPQCKVFFRKPRGWTMDIGWRIVECAARQLGMKYDTSLIGAHAIAGSFLGRALRAVFGDKPEDLLTAIFDSEEQWICSELGAYCLDEQPEYHDRGILARPNRTINPQELFEDREIFEDWQKGTAE